MNRVLPAEPIASLDEYVAAGGRAGLDAARAVASDVVIDELVASGLRGRGGGGFPTGVKWRTVKSFASPQLPTSIVVNAAEGEPGTFKDRAILGSNPYAVLEGALIAAHALDARSIIIATKATFTDQLERVRAAVAEVVAAGWCKDVSVEVVEGPSEYLFGEETGLLEVLDGRPPFPRIAPPFRHGVDEVVAPGAEADPDSGSAATVQLAETDGQSAAPPVLVNNVETMANIPAIIAQGAAWFRSIGTADSPGTIVCTITGGVLQSGVIEVAMGTTVRAAIEMAGGLQVDQRVSAIMVGVSSALLTPDQLDTALTHEAMTAAGSGLGSAGLVVITDDVDPVALAAGVARFLSIESCGQCTHCKQDGLEVASLLAKIAGGDGEPADLDTISTRLGTVADGARCNLASQQQVVVGSILATFDGRVRARVEPGAEPVGVQLVAELLDIGAQGAVVDPTFIDKQPDWSHDEIDSGKTPVERFTDHRADTDTSVDA
ncbi:MAG: hypothetical protein JWN99_2630 [Ilumatobacteraceae bacterium]|nr:hypothetical protein [Ilumatobacteraceae bacterium]